MNNNEKRKRFTNMIIIFSFSLTSFGQSLSQDRFPVWSQLGCIQSNSYLNEVNYDSIRSVNNFNNCETFDYIFNNFLNCKINLPSDTIDLDCILNIPSNFLLNGNNSTLNFITNSQSSLIKIHGSVGNTVSDSNNIFKGFNYFYLPNADILLHNNDLIYISDNDTALVYSSWAEGKTGQIEYITSIQNDTVYLTNKIRRNFNQGKIQIISPVINVGLQNFNIIANEVTSNQTSNISILNSSNCYVECINSFQCNNAHINLSMSSFCTIENSSFSNGFDYGWGGRAYGTIIQAGSSNNLITNNYFNHLRHSILLQSGANGNVISYNYSRDPYWTEPFLDTDLAGDIVLHGNYPYMNLIEGNICQNVVIDNSHGINGPFNTFLRNKAEHAGIFMNFDSGITDSTNFIGNQIPNTNSGLGFYLLFGNGNFTYGNNHQGICKPPNSEILQLESLYLNATPEFFLHEDNWPSIGYPHNLNSGTNLAHFSINNFSSICEIASSLNIKEKEPDKYVVFPNPSKKIIKLQINDATGINFTIQDLNGCKTNKWSIKHDQGQVVLDINELNQGFYILSFVKNNTPNYIKFQKL